MKTNGCRACRRTRLSAPGSQCIHGYSTKVVAVLGRLPLLGTVGRYGRYFLCNAAVFRTRGKFAKRLLGVVPAASLTIDFVSSNFHLSRDHFQWRSFGGDTVRALETITILRQPSCLTLPVRGRDRYRQGLAHFPHGSA